MSRYVIRKPTVTNLYAGYGVETVVVDLTEVSYLDTSGIATLVEGLKVARSRRNTLRIQGLQGRVLHLFEVTGLLRYTLALSRDRCSPNR